MKRKPPKPDLTKYTFGEMGMLIWDIWIEVKRRNPIGVNFYGSYFADAVKVCCEIDAAELENPTCDCDL